MNRIAMFICVQNEERFLETHLRYHHAAGVERVYLFLDQSTDRSREIAGKYSWIDIIEIPPEEKKKHAYICDFHRSCMDLAVEWAREEGWDWLLSIDPDEFVIARPELRSSGGFRKTIDLRDLVSSVDPEVQQIRFPTWEVVPEAGRPWWEQTCFQVEPSVSYQLPGEPNRWRGFLGHRQGKSMVRASARAQAYDSHRWVIDQKHWGTGRPEYAEIPTLWLGCHLHYYLTDPAHLLEKFRKATFEPDRWFCGNAVEPPKQRFKDICREWDVERAAAFMEEEFLPRIEEGEATEVTLVDDFRSAFGEGDFEVTSSGESRLRAFPGRESRGCRPVSVWESLSTSGSIPI